MSDRPPLRALLRIVLAASLLVAVPVSAGESHAYGTLPIAMDGGFIVGLQAPLLSPGASGFVTFNFGNPLAAAITATDTTLQLYAFNAAPGNATGPVPATGSPTLSFNGTTGSSVAISLGTILPGKILPQSVVVSAPSNAPLGAYAIRVALAFASGSQNYLLESRGYFSSAQWESATQLPNGSTTLNLTKLGVSGVVPETAVSVESNPYTIPLVIVLSGAFALAGLGGYYAFRRGPRSKFGAKAPPGPNHAPTAFGRRRRSEGE